MCKKWFFGLFLMFFFLSVSFAQNTSRQNETNWEYLTLIAENCSFLTSGVSFQCSWEWIKESGWEMVGVNECCIYFKRPYNKARTEKEIEWIKKEFNPQKQDEFNLVDLDKSEAKQKLGEFNRSEETKLRNALEKVKDLPLRILTVESKAQALNQQSAAAEIVLDATLVLLKNGNYRSSEAEKYFNENTKRILEIIGLSVDYSYSGNALRISNGGYKPLKFGKLNNYYSGIHLKISVIVNYNNQQNIVAQNFIGGKWMTNP